MQVCKGDLFEHFIGKHLPEVDAIAHVCNAQGVMGSGFAKAVRELFPTAYEEYKKGDIIIPKCKLGTISYAEVRPDKFVFNVIAQEFYGYDGRRYLDYEALYKGLERVKDEMLEQEVRRLGVPFMMGCDRAGGSWKVVSAMLESIFIPNQISVLAVSL